MVMFFRAEVNVITALGKQYRAVSEKTDLYEAIDDVRTEIGPRIKRRQEQDPDIVPSWCKKTKESSQRIITATARRHRTVVVCHFLE